MILDARNDVQDGAELIFDLCIVGSGPAGITLALELAPLGIRICLLEAGGEKFSKKSQEFFRGKVSGTQAAEHLHAYRYRQFGGTSTAWGGRCLPFDPIDFEARDYIPDSGWPISFDTLAPYYVRALEMCQAGPMDFAAPTVLPGQPPEMIAGMPDGDVISSNIERWSPPTNFGKRYRAALRESKTLSLVLNAAGVALHLDPEHKKVVSLTARAGSKTFTVNAKSFVLAAGGIEVPRLMLASDRQIAGGIGNRNDLVGRYYMTHLAGLISTAHLEVDPTNVANQYGQDANGVYVRRRIAFSEETQQRERIPNISMQFHHPPVDDTVHGNAVLSTVFIAKHIQSIRRGIAPGFGISVDDTAKETLALWLRHFKNIVTDFPGFVGFVPRFIRRRYLARRRIPSILLPAKNSVFPIHFHAEQSPNRESRVHLANSRDEYGVPRVRLDFRVTDSDIEGIHRAHTLLDKHFQRYKIGHVHFYDNDPLESIRRATRAINGHFIGTTRMAADPKKGVVDPDCKVFDIDNLYIASSSVFPTSSHANPTLTIVALAIRLADHLRKKKWCSRLIYLMFPLSVIQQLIFLEQS
jgi:choline dehydrogenase-like flavoprotein